MEVGTLPFTGPHTTMARIALISLYDRNAYGLRLLSASLKLQGHECSLVFLKRYQHAAERVLRTAPEDAAWIGIDRRGRPFRHAVGSEITDAELELLGGLLVRAQPDVVGLTVNSPLLRQARKVTDFIRSRIEAPVVWGGYHPTVDPLSSTSWCDYACVGEGDVALLEIARCVDERRNLDDVPNLAFRRSGDLVCNPLAPLVEDLDALPPPDRDPRDMAFIEHDRLEAPYGVLNDKQPGVLQALSSRGCPYHCTYCCEATFKGLYHGQRFLRRRSPESVVNELAEVTRRFNLREIQFEDEIFGLDLRWLREFVPRYRERVGLPFTAYLFPSRQVEEIVALLQSAGLSYCCLALESGSDRMCRDVYERAWDRDLFLASVRACRDQGVGFYTDVITYSPYEREEDLRATLEVLLAAGGPYHICINKLFVMPGTALGERLAADGLQLPDAGAGGVFDYYARLFRIASLSRASATLVAIVERLPWFRRYPRTLDPLVVELLLLPFQPRKLLRRFETALRRVRDRFAPGMAAGTPTTSETSP